MCVGVSHERVLIVQYIYAQLLLLIYCCSNVACLVGESQPSFQLKCGDVLNIPPGSLPTGSALFSPQLKRTSSVKRTQPSVLLESGKLFEPEQKDAKARSAQVCPLEGCVLRCMGRCLRGQLLSKHLAGLE